MIEEYKSEVRLALERWRVQGQVDLECMRDARLSRLEYNPLVDALVGCMETSLLASEKRIHWESRFEVPADWWQHFKQRWFPAWALERWPVRMTVLGNSFSAAARICPHVRVEELGPHARWLAEDPAARLEALVSRLARALEQGMDGPYMVHPDKLKALVAEARGALDGRGF